MKCNNNKILSFYASYASYAIARYSNLALDREITFFYCAIIIIVIVIPFLLMFICSIQLVMVVDARDPLFYRCPDLEVMFLTCL